jgi:hypothetical protein
MSGMGRRALVLVAVVVGCLGPSATASATPLAALLSARDPGARIAGNTIVATGTGGSVFGVPGRLNFIVALGSHATVRGGAGDDQLGALGRGVTVIAGGGEDLVVGGPDGTVVGGGSGHDLLVATQPHTTIKMNAPGDQALLLGRNNRVVCSPRAAREVIYAGRDDSVAKSCRDPDDRVLPIAQLAKPAAHAAAQPVSGDGEDRNPFTAACDNPAQVDCTVSSFPARTLTGFWANEFVPAYKCPTGLRLSPIDYAPFGTSLPKGVEVRGLGPIGIYIGYTLHQRVQPNRPITVDVGTATGAGSSATNWRTGSNPYRVILHCGPFPKLR